MNRSCWLAAIAVALLPSCSQGPAAPERPSVSPRRAANKAISLYDANDDSQLSIFEIANTPLRAAFSQMDADKNGILVARDIADHIRNWQSSSSIIMPACPTFLLDGEPLVGASITLEPAPFLGTGYPSASAVTDSRGRARFVGRERRHPGVYVGMYRVRVSKLKDGQELISARYNSESELFMEIAPDHWADTIFTWFYLDSEQTPEQPLFQPTS